MTREEYIKHRIELGTSHNEKLRKLQREYALSNSPCGIGDIIEDEFGRILVEEIDFSLWGAFPECVYHGTPLRKEDNKPEFNKAPRDLYQSNLKKIISRKEN